MDPDPPKPPGRKVKYAPKAPRSRTAKSAKIEVVDDDDDKDADNVAEQEALSRKLKDKEHFTRSRTRAEKKSASVQVAFAAGAPSSEIRTVGKQREVTVNQSDAAGEECLAPDDQQRKQVTTTSTAAVSGFGGFAGSPNAFSVKKIKDYKEPWVTCSYPPITLPLRKPFSGNPELLDKEEFENAVEYDETTLNTASELGLLGEDNDGQQMIFFQFPGKLPVRSESKGKEIVCSITPPKVSAASKGKEKVGSTPRASPASNGKGCNLSETSLEKLPQGYLGKMLVYRSGAVKLKLGDVLYDVSPGSNCMSAQSAVAIDTTNRHCALLGEPNKRAIVTPDIESLLGSVKDLV